MALEDLTPSNRIEEILNGDDITPSNRLEYFMAKAAEPSPAELPEVTAADAGKVLTVDSEGDWTADDVPEELPEVTSADAGKVLTVNSEGAWGAAESSGGELPTITFPVSQDALSNFAVGQQYLIINTPSSSGNIYTGSVLYVVEDYDTFYQCYITPIMVYSSTAVSSTYSILHIISINKTTGAVTIGSSMAPIFRYPRTPNDADVGKYLRAKNTNGWEYADLPLPELPSDSADGTYTLKATMASGTVTYTWVLDS